MAGWKDTIRQAAIYLLPWVAIGLVLRLWRASLSLVMCRDETTYAFQILHILDGTMFSDTTFYTFPPAYAMLAAPVAYLTGDAELAGRMISCLAGAATAVPVFYLAKDLFGTRTATVAAAVTALLPSMQGAGVMSEPTYTLLIAAGLFFGNRAYMTKSRALFALFGLAFAAAYLARPEAFFVFFALGALFAFMLARGGAGRGRVLRLSAFALAGFFVLALPYMVQLRMHFGAWEISGKTRINLAKARAFQDALPGENFDAADSRLYKELESGKKNLAGNVIAELEAIMQRYPANMKAELVELKNAAGYPLLAAFLVGTGFAFKRPRRLETLGPLLVSLVPLLLIPMVFILQRIIVPYLPVVIVLAAFGAASLAGAAVKRLGADGKKGALPAATALLSAGLLVGNFGGVLPETDFDKRINAYPSLGYYYALKGAAAQIRPFIAPGSKVMTRNNIFAYYAGCEYLPIPSEDIGGVVQAAREKEARYLFCGPMELQLRPRLGAAIMKDGYPAEDPAGDGSLRLVYSRGVFMLYKVYDTQTGG